MFFFFLSLRFVFAGASVCDSFFIRFNFRCLWGSIFVVVHTFQVEMLMYFWTTVSNQIGYESVGRSNQKDDGQCGTTFSHIHFTAVNCFFCSLPVRLAIKIFIADFHTEPKPHTNYVHNFNVIKTKHDKKKRTPIVDPMCCFVRWHFSLDFNSKFKYLLLFDMPNRSQRAQRQWNATNVWR